jgi:hypothetical protein
MSKKKNIWPGLGSKIEFSTPTPESFDGSKKQFLLGDEAGCGFGTPLPKMARCPDCGRFMKLGIFNWNSHTINECPIYKKKQAASGILRYMEINAKPYKIELLKQKPIDMYQGRREDLDPRVDKVLEEGPNIDKAMEDVEDALKEIYKLREKTITSVNFHSGFHKHYTATLYHLSRDWDYTKEFKESLDKLNQAVLDAYITFLECEREELIKRWNDMAKELKPKK